MDKHIAAPHQIEAMDKYTASIELSNACRQFYKSRLEAAQCIKSRWGKDDMTIQQFTSTPTPTTTTNDNDRPTNVNCSSSNTRTNNASSQRRPTRSSIDQAMDKLRAEMTSLIDQDLSLMKQLLTLNETIEDLKWQRRYYYHSPPSSADLANSDCSISDTEMFAESDEDLVCHSDTATTSTTTTPMAAATSTTCLSLSPSSSSHRKHSLTPAKSFPSDKCLVDSQLPHSEAANTTTSSVKVYHSEQDSFDSGIHESGHEEVASV